MRSGSLLPVVLSFAAAVAFGAVTPALEPTAPMSAGEVLPVGESLLTDLMTTDLMEADLEARPLDAYEVDDKAEPLQVAEVPEPATVVGLATLAAMAGGTLLLRLRWFRRR